jgi:hypothetical protein
MGSSLPAAKSLTIWDTSPCPPAPGVPVCNWPTVLTTDQPWLSVGSAAGTTSLTTSVSVEPASLAAGVYTGNIIATATELAGSPIRIPVTLTVSPAPKYSYNLEPTPVSLSFEWTMGSSLPATKSLTIWDTSPCPPAPGVPVCNWPTVLTTDQPWLSVGSAAGTTSLTTSVSVEPASLAAGVYTGNIIATATELAGSPIRVPITLSVTSPVTPATLTATPVNLAFGSVALGNDATQSVTLTNNGSSSVTISTVSLSGPGLAASGISSGQVLASHQTATLTITFAPTATGSVNGGITITSTASNSPTTVATSGTGVAGASHSVVLTWNPSTDTVAGYKVYRATTSGGPYTELGTNLDASASFTDNSANSGMTYYYIVTAVDSLGNESAYSNQVSATVP